MFLTHSTSRSEFTRLLRLLGVSFPDKTSIDSLSEGGCWNVQTPMRRCQVAHGSAWNLIANDAELRV